MSNVNKHTNLDLVRIAAADNGDLHSPKWYIDYIAEKYGRRVNPSDVTKAIGKWSNRANGTNSLVLDAARSLMKTANYDYGLASNVLKRVAL